MTTVLNDTDYSLAVKAHDAREPVIAKGDLARVRQRWHLSNARLSIFSLDDIGAEDDDEENEGAADA